MKLNKKIIKIVTCILLICILISNLNVYEVHAKKKTYTVCIDPGHYATANKIKGKGSYGYSEGAFALKIGKALRKELKAYGIKVKMTRTGKHIKMNGVKDKTLDSYYISLRGRYAAGCDLFISLHTNSNSLNANDCDTLDQPLSLNKTMIILNQKAMKNSKSIKIANQIGKAVTKESYLAGLMEENVFETRTKRNLKYWTPYYNDTAGTVGTLVYRKSSRGDDYYGVLRGASAVGVPGMIVEHGYHSIKDVRKAAKQTDLAERWAKADAYAIAKGFGLVK